MLQDAFFVVSKILGPLLAPKVVLYWLLVLAIVGLFTKQAKAARRLALAVLIAAALLGGSPLGGWALQSLEDRFPAPTSLPEKIDGIVVLGGDANNSLLNARPYSPGNIPPRQLAFADLARRYPDAKLVYSGGSGKLGAPEETDAGGARTLLPLLGLDPSRVLFEDRSRNTYENAVFTFKDANPKPGEIWLLITSARHMPRAIGCFRRVGWSVVPFPVGYVTLPASGQRWSIPMTFADDLGSLSSAISEYAGLLYYFALGRTDALFPKPEE
ncbi:YdcF family protein [Sphingomonas daechungensis]|uniref:YdcF family protein n=1 Tax=Sphingomonas daechungensis TaxID=1176646 RepID=UPI00378505B0